MKRRAVSILLLLSLVLAVVPVAAATEAGTEETTPVREPGQCGETMTWAYEDGVLTVTGEGAMDDYEDGAPWAEHRDEIREVVLTGGVTYVGARAFRDYDALEKVDFGDALYEIGAEAFLSCEGLTAIYLPRSFKIFGESSFLSCTNLTQIHCEGSFPSFRLNSMWDTYATIYFPAERPWPVATIAQLEEAFKGRIEFIASDGTDPYVPEEPTAETTEPTEETTEPTEEITEPTGETTEPSEVTTEPAEEPAEQATTEQTQEPATSEETAAAVPTEEETVPTEEDFEGGRGWIGLLIVGIVLTVLAVGGLIFRKSTRRGRYSGR